MKNISTFRSGIQILFINSFIFIICAVNLISFCSCNKDNNLVKPWVKPIWELNLHKNGVQSNSIIRANIVFDNKVVLATTDGPGNRFITCVDIFSGSELWNWNNIYQPPTEYFDIRYALIYDELMFYQVGTRSYCINLNNGDTYFKNRGEISYHTRFSTFMSYALLLGNIQDTISGETAYGVNIIDIHSPTITPLLLAPFDSNSINTEYHGIGGFSSALISVNGKCLVATYAFLDSLKNVVSKLGLFDLINKTWLYSNIPLSDNPQWYTSISQIPIIYNDKIFINVGTTLVCHDFWTGQRLWVREFHHDFLFSGYIIEDDQLLANCENGIFYCINPATGAIKWHLEGAGTSSPLRYLNGIVYFSGGSTGRIHGIDTNTGEYVWMLEPDRYDHSEDFKPDIYVVQEQNGEKGKVIICTPEKAYCLPAYR